MGLDKAQHFAGGAAISVAAILFGINGWEAFAVASLVGLAKEVRDDLSGKGTPDSLDFAATAAGGALGVPLGFLARLILGM